MALSIAQVAFDRLLKDVEEKALEPPVYNADQVLLRSYFLSEVGPLIANKNALTRAQQLEVAMKARALLRHYHWINSADPCWKFVVPRMMEHLSDVASSPQPSAASLDSEGGIPDWAPPLPNKKVEKGTYEMIPCVLCRDPIVAPKDHLAFRHGIDTPVNRYGVRWKHIVRMEEDVLIQHLIQDGAELNQLQRDILAIESELESLVKGYESTHGLQLNYRYEDHREDGGLYFEGNIGQRKQGLATMLVDLREAGLARGIQGWGTYEETLADFKAILRAQKE